MSPKTDLKKSPKQKKHQKVAKSFSVFFGKKKLHPLPTFNKKTKKKPARTPTWDVFFFFEVYLATNVRIFGAVPQVCSFVEFLERLKLMDEFFHVFSRWWQLKDVLFSPLFGEDFQFDKHNFQMGGSTTNQFFFCKIFPRHWWILWFPSLLSPHFACVGLSERFNFI